MAATGLRWHYAVLMKGVIERFSTFDIVMGPQHWKQLFLSNVNSFLFIWYWVLEVCSDRTVLVTEPFCYTLLG